MQIGKKMAIQLKVQIKNVHLSWKVMKLSRPCSSCQLNLTSLWLGQSLCNRASALLGKASKNIGTNISFSTAYPKVMLHYMKGLF